MSEARLHVVVVAFRVRPAAVSDFESLLVRNAAQSLELEEGCLQFDVCQQQDQPASFLLYELYASAEAFEAHLQMPHFRQFDAAVTSMVISKEVNVLKRSWPARAGG